MDNNFDFTPDPRILRILGEIEMTPLQCLCELIDNSIDAFPEDINSETPEIIINLSRENDIEDSPIIVKDNGTGMSREQLEKSVRAGYSGNNGMDSLGLFGVGFNIATSKLGFKTEIITCRKEDDFMLKAIIDLRKMERTKKFIGSCEKLPKPNDDIQKHGTEVRIYELKKDFVDKLRRKTYFAKQLGRTYSRIIRNKNIDLIFEGVNCKPFKHFRWSEVRKGRKGVPAYWPIDATLNTQKYCTSCFEWLNFEDLICPVCSEKKFIVERKKKIKGWIGLQCYWDKKEFGIDLIRNGRVISKNDKTLFDWFDENKDEDIPEYPIDGQVGGRIIGELEIDFIQVDFLKKKFVTESRDWKDFVIEVRGEGPLQPIKAKKLGYGENNSPLFVLYNTYRKTTPGIDNFVPRVVGRRNSGIFSGQMIELKEKFFANETEYNDDTKAWELILKGERQDSDSGNNSQNSSGENAEDIFGEDDDSEDTDTNNSLNSNVGNSSNNKKEEFEKDDNLSMTYSIELDMNRAIKVEAFRNKKGDNQKGFIVEPQGASMTFKYWPNSKIFKETFFLPQDFLINEISYLLMARSNIKVAEYPSSTVKGKLQKKYFPDLYPEIEFLRQEIDDITDSLENHITNSIKNTEFKSSDLSKDSLDRIRRNMSYERLNEDELMNEKIEKGEFISYADFKIFIEIFEKYPDLLFDGIFFKRKISSQDVLSTPDKELFENALLMFKDVIWWKENGTSSPNKIWKARGRRVAASLEVIRGWQP